MDIRVKSTDFDLTDEVSKYLDERIAAIEKMMGGDADVTRCEVEVGRDAGRPRHGANIYFAEFHVIYPHGSVRATNHSESVSGAIDDAKEEVIRQLRRERKAHVRMWRRSGSAFKRLLRMEE